MKAQLIKELGTVDLDRVEATSGQITVFVPIKVVENDLSGMLDKLEVSSRKIKFLSPAQKQRIIISIP